MKIHEKALGFNRDRSLTTDRKKKAGEREDTPHTNRKEKIQRHSRSMGADWGSSFDASEPEESLLSTPQEKEQTS